MYRLIGLSLAAANQELADGAIHLRWGDKLEIYTLAAMGHGTPINSRDLGRPGPFILEAGISSTRRIAQFWGLESGVLAQSAKTKPVRAEPIALPTIEAALIPEKSDELAKAARIESVIRRALKAAGLIRS